MELRVSGYPVQSLNLIGEDDARELSASGYVHFKCAALDLIGNWASEQEARADIEVKWRKHKSRPTAGLLCARVRGEV